MKKILSRTLAMVLAVLMLLPTMIETSLLSFATASRSENFSKAYQLTGNQAQDIVNVGLAQEGKVEADLGYNTSSTDSGRWCADFVCDCAKLAGISTNIIPFTGGVSELRSGVINKGGTVVTSPQCGDLVFYYCTTTNSWAHVGIMVDSTNSVQGNISNKVWKGNYTWYRDGKGTNGTCYTVSFVRPHYSSSSTPTTYTITYDANGGTGAPAPTNYSDETGFIVPETIPTRAGYSFLGWSLTENGSAFFHPGKSASISPAKNVTLYAIWSANTITVTLNANGGTLGTSQFYFRSGINRFYSDSACTNEITKITVPTRAGHRFQYFYGNGTSGGENEEVYIYGYSADPEDAGAFAWDLSQDITKDAVLFAKWKPYVLTMNYNVNGGTINSSKYYVNDSLVCFTDGSKFLNDQWDYGTADLEYGLYDAATFGLTREGYTFVGWSLSADGSTTIYDQADNTVRSQTICPDLATGDRSVVFYAIWEKIPATLTITYDANGGSGAPAMQTETEGKSFTLSSITPTRDGYAFTGWNTKADGSGTNYAAGSGCTANADLTFYAQWEKVSPDGFLYAVIDGCVTIKGYVGSKTEISIPSVIEGKPVTSIGDKAFYRKTDLTSVSIPNSVTTIEQRAFYSCRKLVSITIPDSVTTIGDWAFSGCKGLTSITIPDSVTSIGWEAFFECIYLTSIIIPDSITTISKYTFEGCYRLSSITIPDSVTFIGENAFKYCESLANVNYAGTQAQWDAIEIESGNDTLLNAAIAFASTPVDPDAPQIYVESKTVSRGTEFTVTVEVKNNPGVMSMTLKPLFSDKLSLVKAVNGTIMSDFTAGNTKYLWNADSDVTANGVLFTLTFTTAETLEPGEYPVSFSLWDSSDSQENDVNFAIVSGVITVTDVTWGDANGDGVVNNKDIVRLKNYLANLDDETGLSTVEIIAGADANGDGVVNNKDIVRLKNYLANLDDETGLSTVTLGPA